MAKPAKRKVPSGGRVTPKGGPSASSSSSATSSSARSAAAKSKSTSAKSASAKSAAAKSQSSRTTPPATSRYTPPIPSEYKVSPRWVPVLMFTFLGAGMLMIFLNYLGVVPGGTSNWYLLGGLGLILAGIITATQYH